MPRAMATAGRKFSYYRRLSAAQRRVYDRSDSIQALSLPQAERFHLCVCDLGSALERDDRGRVQRAAERLVGGLCTVFAVPQMDVKVLAIRPSRRWGELHGLYESGKARRPVLTVWMRTAKLGRAVAFRTFIRTIVHEFVHHLDFALFRMGDSFHTQGFYARESAIAGALIGGAGSESPYTYSTVAGGFGVRS
jgi:hypothetical protein